ncbi:MAG: GAF domain-containing protein, partial [Chloroflexi bacterium]|nr:GAF domain-containing protein [Chloroflexota bacterium]
MGLLRWVAIVVPMLFIVAVDILRQTIFSHHAYVFPGYAGLVFTYVITLVAVVVFSYAIFGVIGRLQRSIVEQNRQSQLQNQELEALLAVGKVVTSSFDQDELLSTLLDTVVRVTSAQAAEVWRMDKADELTLRCHRGSHREAFLEKTSLRMGEGIPGIVAQSQEPMVVHDLPSDRRFLRQAVTRAGFHTFYAQPLHYQGKLVGVFAVAAMEEDALGETWEIRLMEGIGEWLAIAMENTRLYQQVQDFAVLQERERIAREMHDGMAQLLGYINTQTIAVRRLLSDKRYVESQEELTKMEEIARDLYADVREGILGLRTPALRRDGLIPALREYAERYTEMSGVRVEIQESSGN